MKLCGCGCGEAVTVGSRYRHGHWAKTAEGALSISEAHTKEHPTDHGDGYLSQSAGFKKGRALHHRLVMEEIVGRQLLDSEIVHHKDENKGNNDPANLILCRDSAEHHLLHLQAEALRESGHLDWRKCSFCKQWDKPENLYVPPRRGTVEHRACGNSYRKKWAAKKRYAMPKKQKSRNELGQFIFTAAPLEEF